MDRKHSIDCSINAVFCENFDLSNVFDFLSLKFDQIFRKSVSD